MFLVLATLIATHTFIGKEYRHVSANCSQVISTQRISQLRPRRFFKHSCVQNVAVYIGVYSLVLYIGFWMLAIDGQTRQSLIDCRCLTLSMYYRYIILYYFCTEFQYTLYWFSVHLCTDFWYTMYCFLVIDFFDLVWLNSCLERPF